MEEHSSLLVIAGPTGVGKTALALTWAQKFDGELVSVDSRQVYAGMDIGTGKEVDQGVWEERQGERVLVIGGVPVHGLDLVRPDEPFSVAEWLRRMVPVIEGIKSRGCQPILVGGTGFYLDALEGKLATLSVPPDLELRESLQLLPIDNLYAYLEKVDGERARQMNESDRRNPVRLIRAIELAVSSKQKAKGGSEKEHGGYRLCMLGLTAERQELYQRADARVEKMFDQGLVAETKQLLEQFDPGLPSMSGIGYWEVARYAAGELTLEQAKQGMKYRNHSYIRRQLAWFKRQPIVWIRADEEGWREKATAEARRLLGL